MLNVYYCTFISIKKVWGTAFPIFQLNSIFLYTNDIIRVLMFWKVKKKRCHPLTQTKEVNLFSMRLIFKANQKLHKKSETPQKTVQPGALKREHMAASILSNRLIDMTMFLLYGYLWCLLPKLIRYRVCCCISLQQRHTGVMHVFSQSTLGLSWSINSLGPKDLDC